MARMALTLIYNGTPHPSADATADGENLWLSNAELRAATGWERQTPGLCLGDRCVPIPPGRSAEFVSADDRFNLAAFARLIEQPVVHDDAAGVWLFGEAAGPRRAAMLAGEAPDFRLPDLESRIHSLSDYRGKKVLLVSWASW
jgi:hypothetical protein